MEFVLVVLVVAFVRSEFADSAPDTEQEAVSAALYIAFVPVDHLFGELRSLDKNCVRRLLLEPLSPLESIYRLKVLYIHEYKCLIGPCNQENLHQ